MFFCLCSLPYFIIHIPNEHTLLKKNPEQTNKKTDPPNKQAAPTQRLGNAKSQKS